MATTDKTNKCSNCGREFTKGGLRLHEPACKAKGERSAPSSSKPAEKPAESAASSAPKKNFDPLEGL